MSSQEAVERCTGARDAALASAHLARDWALDVLEPAAEDEADLWNNVDAVWNRMSEVSPESGDPYPVSVVDLAIMPRVINMAAAAPIVAAFTFESEALAADPHTWSPGSSSINCARP